MLTSSGNWPSVIAGKPPFLGEFAPLVYLELFIDGVAVPPIVLVLLLRRSADCSAKCFVLASRLIIPRIPVSTDSIFTGTSLLFYYRIPPYFPAIAVGIGDKLSLLGPMKGCSDFWLVIFDILSYLLICCVLCMVWMLNKNKTANFYKLYNISESNNYLAK